MLRFIYVIIANLFRAPWIIPKMRRMASHPDNYSIAERYALAQQMIRYMSASGRITTAFCRTVRRVIVTSKLKVFSTEGVARASLNRAHKVRCHRPETG